MLHIRKQLHYFFYNIVLYSAPFDPYENCLLVTKGQRNTTLQATATGLDYKIKQFKTESPHCHRLNWGLRPSLPFAPAPGSPAVTRSAPPAPPSYYPAPRWPAAKWPAPSGSSCDKNRDCGTGWRASAPPPPSPSRRCSWTPSSGGCQTGPC